MAKPKNVYIFDIETTGLRADFYRMLSFGYMRYPEGRPKILSLLDTNPVCGECRRINTEQDEELVKRVYPILCEADLLVSWYGREGNGFDAKFLNTRILAAGLPPLPLIPQVDLWVTARNRFAFTNNRLVRIQEFLELTEEKSPLLMRTWEKAGAGDIKALKYVVEHNRKDILVLKEAYDILRPWVLNHPRVNGYGPCPVCGNDTLTRHKERMTRTKGRVVQYRCITCGGYDTRMERDGKDKQTIKNPH